MVRAGAPGQARAMEPALHRALPVLLVPLVLLGGLVASRGGAAERFWGLGIPVAVLVVGAVVVTVGVRAWVRERRGPEADATNGPFAASTRPESPFAPPDRRGPAAPASAPPRAPGRR
ncbi:hypothetical protein EV188_1011030 [Actinomycetospora succinea]|uniref:Uncharacterized protein n=1 Tax=Actinomycetospora succinea TaxID=663603 RepID=A0A4V3DBA1_9PSEU|nr:hypothetical protein EV188_1011030 [Actinomycetospora succinea]